MPKDETVLEDMINKESQVIC